MSPPTETNPLMRALDAGAAPAPASSGCPPEDNPSMQFARAAIPLLKEYEQKLRDIVARARALRDLNDDDREGEKYKVLRALFTQERERFRRLSPAAGKLARQVSQRLEHTDLGEATRVELELRLAEYEHALLATEPLLTALAF